MSEEKRAYIFLETMPQRQGSGASLRFYSNVRAYLDLGFAVEVIHLGTEPDGSEPSPDLRPVVWTRVFEPAAPPTLAGRLMFRAGLPARAAVAYHFQKHALAAREVAARLRQSPSAVFHLEGEALSTILPWLPRSARAIWSLHDLPSTVSAATTKIACDAEGRAPTTAERRELRFLRRAERFVARRAPLILCIAQHDGERLRDEWGCPRAEYLPMSIPGDGAARRTAGWLEGGRLRLLHLGSVSHLPSYRSLEFLFEQVFPRLPARVLERLSMDVVGRVDRENARTRKVIELAAPYPNVSFRGFVEDVVPYYQNNDLQVVASTDASGLRTRTIESFAYGLPVLSTTVGARGIARLKAGEHLLIADDPAQFGEQLSSLIESPEMLERLSHSGRSFYEKFQSRGAVASSLLGHLEKYFGFRGDEAGACAA